MLCQTAVPFSNFQNRRKPSFVWGNGTEKSHPKKALSRENKVPDCNIDMKGTCFKSLICVQEETRRKCIYLKLEREGGT